MNYINREEMSNITEPGDYLILCSGNELQHFDGEIWTYFNEIEIKTYMNEVYKRINNRFWIP